MSIFNAKTSQNIIGAPPQIQVVSVSFSLQKLHIRLVTGSEISASLERFPRLSSATPKQRATFQIDATGSGIHWPDIDEDISASGLLGLPD